MHSTRVHRARRPGLDWHSQTFTLSHAKTYLGRLVEKAAKGETVYIAKGSRRFVLQEVPEIEPIPLRPPGYFSNCYTAEEVQEDNRLAEFICFPKPDFKRRKGMSLESAAA